MNWFFFKDALVSTPSIFVFFSHCFLSRMQKIARKQFETKLKDFDLVIVGNGLEAVSAASKFMEEHNTTFSVIWMDVM